jgi:hypothetical protein
VTCQIEPAGNAADDDKMTCSEASTLATIAEIEFCPEFEQIHREKTRDSQCIVSIALTRASAIYARFHEKTLCFFYILGARYVVCFGFQGRLG